MYFAVIQNDRIAWRWPKPTTHKHSVCHCTAFNPFSSIEIYTVRFTMLDCHDVVKANIQLFLIMTIDSSVADTTHPCFSILDILLRLSFLSYG